MEFKKVTKPVVVNDPWYDLTDGGYIKPENLLASKDDVKRVKEAIKLIKQFLNEAEENGVIEVI